MSEHVELLTKVANLSMLAFMVSNMLGFGMRLKVEDKTLTFAEAPRSVRPAQTDHKAACSRAGDGT